MEKLLAKALKTLRLRKEKEKSSKQTTNLGISKKGMGFASFMHGSGFTGSGEKTLASIVGAEATSEGKVRSCRRAPKSGRGMNTLIFSQIAADSLGITTKTLHSPT